MLLNIFEEKVFDDTTYTVCSFQFELIKDSEKLDTSFRIMIYPSKKEILTKLDDSNNYLIGGEIYNLKLNYEYSITRLTKKNQTNSNKTNILVKCIDDNKNSKIGMEYVEDSDIYVDETPNQTARTYATLIIEPKIDIFKQKLLVEKFNRYLNQNREQYYSLFLTNYRESKDIARKRISFDLVYKIVGYILENFENI